MKNILKNHLFLWKLCFKTAPGFMLYYLYDGIRLEGFIFLEHTIGIYYVLQCAEDGTSFQKVAIFIGVLVLLEALQLLFDGIFHNSMMFKSKPKLYRTLKEKMFEQAAKLDLACYDDPKYYDNFVLSVSESEKSIDRFLEMLSLLTKSLTGVITAGGFFLVMNPMGLAFVALSFVLTLFISKFLNRLNFKVRMEENTHERKRKYAERVFYLNDYAKELRLNPQIGDILEEDFQEANERILEIEKKYWKKRSILGFLRNYAASDFISEGLYVTYLVFQAAILHTVSFSAAAVLFRQIGRMKGQLKSLADVYPKAQENSMYMDKIREFMSYEPKIQAGIGEPLPEGDKTIELKNVSFSYNEKDGDILRGVNLILHPGEKVALVGYNGAGKTTLIKVLMRLYDPTEGEILLNGKDIRTYDLTDYRRHIGVIFQDFKIYGASLLENVVLDDLNRAKVSKERVKEALVESGFKNRLDSLKEGLDAQLTTEFDEKGVNLSGGESQKVAIARVFYQNAEVMIMDEPSSALDPIAEYGLNKAMQRAAKNKTVVYISHRLSTTRDADRIFMLEKGKIIEEGTHQQLLEEQGKYATMWQVQAGKYN